MDLKWDRRYKRRRAVIWIIVLFLLVLNVNLGIYPNGAKYSGQGCISVSFDKVPLLLADRIVVRQGDARYEITDRKLIWDVVTESRIPTNAGLRHMQTDRWIEIYCGDLLVRNIRWATALDGDVFVVYKADSLHWILPEDLSEGQVFPPADLIARLEAACGT